MMFSRRIEHYVYKKNYKFETE